MLKRTLWLVALAMGWLALAPPVRADAPRLLVPNLRVSAPMLAEVSPTPMLAEVSPTPMPSIAEPARAKRELSDASRRAIRLRSAIAVGTVVLGVSAVGFGLGGRTCEDRTMDRWERTLKTAGGLAAVGVLLDFSAITALMRVPRADRVAVRGGGPGRWRPTIWGLFAGSLASSALAVASVSDLIVCMD